MLTLIENGEVFAPEPLGKLPVLLSGPSVLRVGCIDGNKLAEAGLDVDVVDAEGCYVVPGFIDPHEHLLGGSGESGFSTQTPEIATSEIATAGITTVVGCLGVDTTMKTLAGLLAKVKALKEEGLNAYMWSGGYNIPPTTITNSIGNDIMFIEEVIGAGEIAISDERSAAPTAQELARIAHDVYTSGMLSKKAGRVHFHVGSQPGRLKPLRDMLEQHDIKPEWLYPTHINRSNALMLEAIQLAKNGSFVDIDTVDEDLVEKVKFYFDNGAPPEKLTVSSDSSITSPQNLFRQVRQCVVEAKLPLEQILPLVTSNTAAALKLDIKGRIAEGKAADVLVISKEAFELVEVIGLGRRLVKDGKVTFKENFLKDSNRQISLDGKKAEPGSGDKSDEVFKAESATK